METLQRTANRGSVSTGYNIDNSVKFEADNREYLRWTNFSSQASAARKKKFTFSVWVKRTELGGNQQVFISTSQNGYLTFEANNQLTWIQQYGGSQLVINTTRVFRDTSAWYHIMVVVDTAQSTEADRTKIYVNGEQETVFDAAAYPSQNAEASNLFEQHLIVGEWGGTSLGFCGYMAEYYFLSEIAASPTDLGEFDEDSGIWKPKEYDGTISSPSHFLEFKDGSDLGTATSGLDSDYQNNLTAVDQATDTPTNNFTTFNPLNPTYGTSVISEGGTKAQGSGQNTFDNIQTTIGVTKGKWYCEVEPQVDVATRNTAFGVVNLDTAVYSGDHYGAAGFWSGGFDDGARIWYYFNGSSPGAPTVNYGTGSGDTAGTIGVALDLDNATLKFYIRNSLQTNQYIATSLPAGTYAFFGDVQGGGAPYLNFNFGGYTVNSISSAASDANGYGTFEYAPPTGYYALCTKNLAEYG